MNFFYILIFTCLAFIAGYNKGTKDTHREAFENGLMVTERVGGKIVYRWLETHDFELE